MVLRGRKREEIGASNLSGLDFTVTLKTLKANHPEFLYTLRGCEGGGGSPQKQQ